MNELLVQTEEDFLNLYFKLRHTIISDFTQDWHNKYDKNAGLAMKKALDQLNEKFASAIFLNRKVI